MREGYAALDASITGKSRDHLARIVAKLLQSGAALDLKRWVRGVDLSADRVGFLVAHDLETALEIIKASDESSSSVPRDGQPTASIRPALRGSGSMRSSVSITLVKRYLTTSSDLLKA